MPLDRSPESILAQNEFDVIFGLIEQNCEDKLTRKLIN